VAIRAGREQVLAAVRQALPASEADAIETRVRHDYATPDCRPSSGAAGTAVHPPEGGLQPRRGAHESALHRSEAPATG
jgi:hypothetical protein